METTWLDRAIGFLAPRAGLKRLRARVAHERLAQLARHYEGAAMGRRTQGWRTSSADSNAVTGPALARLREVARDLVRNNPYAESALTTIADHVVGWGIVAKPKDKNRKAAELWKAWAETTACDSDQRNDIYGLQKLVWRTVVESGECLVRRRIRRPEDELPIPLQLQVLDPDFLDTSKNGKGENGRLIINGVEFDALGRRAAYWLFTEHPGAEAFGGNAVSRAIPAESILHVYKQSRPGQVRGPSWFAPVLLRFKDFDEYEDATLMKQKIAACLAVITTSPDPIGTADESATPQIDSLEPGLIHHVAAGESITVVDPPAVREYADYSKTSLRAIATGLGIPYECLTGDYSDFNFSSARMSRLEHWDHVYDWRWRTLIPQFCDPAWAWAMQAASIMNPREIGMPPAALWTPPPMPFIEPDKEGLAISRNIRAGITTLSESLRERGYDPLVVLDEMETDNELLDERGLILDSDPRKTTQAGQPREPAKPPAAPPALPPAAPDEELPPERKASRTRRKR